MRLLFVLAVLFSSCRTQLPPLPPPPERAVLVFNSGITDDSVAEFAAALKRLEPAGKVLVVLTTQGGEVFAGLRMSQLIIYSPALVSCFVPERAESMGLVIFQSCQGRVMAPTARLLGHRPRIAMGEPSARMTRMLDALSTVMSLTITSQSKMTFEEYNLVTSEGKDFVLDAPTAVKLGFADAISP